MTDTFTGPAAQNIDNAKAQALAAVAQSGSQGKAALDQAAQANAAAKTSALKDAMAYAALRGAPQGNVAAGQGIVSAPFDDRAATLAGIGANYAANNQAMSAANEGFFSGARAGLPAVKGMLDQKVAGLQQASAMKQAALNAQLVARQNANDLSALRLQLAEQKANAPKTPAQIVAELGGAANAGDQIQQAAQQLTSGRLQRSMNDTTTSAAQNDLRSGSLQEQIGQATGLAPGEGTTLSAKDNAPPALPAENARDKALGEAMGLQPNPGTTYTEHVSAIRANPDYAKAQVLVNQIVGHNGSSADLQHGLTQLGLDPNVVALVMAENPSLHPTRGSLQ